MRGEVGRLLPRLGSGDQGSGPEQGGWEQGWQRGRLFLAVAELLDAAARSSGAEARAGAGAEARAGAGVALVVEDVHWADSASLDFLTFLTRAGYRDAVTVVATCRGDEAPATHVADWLLQVRGAAGVEEIRVGPLSRAELAGQVAGLAGGPVLPRVVDELYARAEGNPFFTEQLVAATLADASEGGLLQGPAGLPARLAELLAARAGRCAGNARAVLAGLAVAGRPLAEEPLAAVTGLDAEALRGGLRELAAARLLAEDTSGGEYRPRHALLAEAVAAGLLPGERAALHGSVARALAASGDDRVAEVAGHWQAAGNPAAELPARIAAAEAAERVFGYAEAAAHWQRAIELGQARPGGAGVGVGGLADTADVAGGADVGVGGLGVPRMYVRAIDTLDWSGAGVRAERVAEEAFRRFAGHCDPATAAAVCHRAGRWRAVGAPDAGLALIEEALRLFEQAPPSADQAEAWLDYADMFLWSAGGWSDGTVPALNRALKIAEATGAGALIPRVLARIAASTFRRGQVEEGFAVLERGWTLARAMDDASAQVWLAANESDALLKLAKFASAAEVAMRALGPAREAGLQASWRATILASNASEALLAGGRTAEAAALIDPLITGPPDRDNWLVHLARADIDLLRGDTDAAAARRRLTDAIPARLGYYVDYARESAQRAVELAVWAGRPGDALAEVRRVLGLFKVSDLAIFSGRLLATGMRACADLAARARARRDEPAAQAAGAAADGLASWVDHMAGVPFAEHRFAATSPAERAGWDAERTRVAGASDPEAWGHAAKTWEGLSCPHRAGYAWWRQAQARLDAGQPAAEAAAALRAAAAAADGHAPLQAQVRLLAERARIPLQPQPAAADQTPAPERYGLTGRELAVLRLLAAGRSNAQIGAELYISPSTASVHVTSILRKLGVSSRVQAAALAERAGLLPSGPA